MSFIISRFIPAVAKPMASSHASQTSRRMLSTTSQKATTVAQGAKPPALEKIKKIESSITRFTYICAGVLFGKAWSDIKRINQICGRASALVEDVSKDMSVHDKELNKILIDMADKDLEHSHYRDEFHN
jgi:hypothetical protein